MTLVGRLSVTELTKQPTSVLSRNKLIEVVAVEWGIVSMEGTHANRQTEALSSQAQ